ncbi:Heat shock 70 kDa protein 12A [Psilocybe cubensis]|uniref:Uncharacterized protein n=2 Tax=Psilocybe cubensis TaxID=181762 RepID=A0A8H7Y5W9_PSICU|nr:Heat shock 70 kDa protein 12A [Psilocybe cubensis]KAH9485830.1 Heat shock 70 kDa protein 12A [Psilocybe cubensis]
MTTLNRPRYDGTQRKLVLAFDIGTTFSGISYSILDPGEVPEIRGVTRFPAQEHVGGDSKIPTIIYYDKQGDVRAVGAEAVREGIEADAEDEGWTKAEWFKLHLRPQTTSSGSSLLTGHPIPPLPEGKTIIDVFGDFMRYLHQCARTYIEDTYPNGAEMWKNLEGRTDFVLTHPNGWEGTQQSYMRRAAVRAGLIPNTPAGQQRLSFVTEGEASLHFCIQKGLTIDAMKQGKGILIVDAGGGTVDISAYKQTSKNAQSFEEIFAPECHFQGSVFISNHAREFLEKLLKDSRFAEDVPYITDCFDKTTKLRFRSDDETQFIKFGTIRDKDLALNIRNGQLKLSGSDVASFFEPSIQCIVDTIEEQRAACTTKIASVFLVGGFAASDWLFTNLKARLSDNTLDICRPDSHVNKAVADGAVSFYLDHFVAARISKYAYGIEFSRIYVSTDPEHVARMHSQYTCLDGRIMLPVGFDAILPKARLFDTKVSETEEYRHSYVRNSKNSSAFQILDEEIMCYQGTKSNPRWTDEETDMYRVLCHVTADTSNVPLRQYVNSKTGIPYYRIEFEIVLSFGLTELKAQVAWKENGIERRGPAEVVYDPDELICD